MQTGQLQRICIAHSKPITVFLFAEKNPLSGKSIIPPPGTICKITVIENFSAFTVNIGSVSCDAGALGARAQFCLTYLLFP